MTEEHLVLVVVAIAIALAFVLAAALVNRARTPEHDLRRRALAIVAGFGSAPICAAAAGSSLVAVVMVVAWAVVILAGLRLVLREPPTSPRP